MQQLSQDAADLSNYSKKASQSLLDLLGYDVDSSAMFDSMIPSLFQDTLHISVGGQTVSQNQTINLQVYEDGIVDLYSLGICGEFSATNSNVPFNMLQLFRGTQMKLGSKAISCQSFAHVYQQIRLAASEKHIIDPLRESLWLHECGEYDNYTGTQATVASLAFENVFNQQKARSLYKTATRKHFYIPLWLIFPQLQGFDRALFVRQQTNQLMFSMQTMPNNKCIFGGLDSDLGSYSLTNMHLFVRYARLPSPQLDMVLRSEFQFPINTYDSFKITGVKNVNNLTFNVSKGQRVKRLLFCFASANSATKTSTSLTTAPLLFAANNFTSESNLMVPLPVQQVEVNLGSQQFTLNATQLEMLDLLSVTQSINTQFQQSQGIYQGIVSDLRKYYAINLDRFCGVDDFGSSAKQSGNILVKILVSDSIGESQMGAITNFATDVTANIDLYGFLEFVDTQMMLKNGVYSAM